MATSGLRTDLEDQKLPPLPLVWLEVLLLSAALPLLGRLLRPHDPLWRDAPFPWLVLAPLLLGLRHGFTRALCSALCLDGLLLLEARGAGRPLPGVLCLGILLTAMLAGEFCDLWQRRLQQLDELNRYRREHLAHFTRAYHLLALSHERLERRALCNTRSLREALSELRRRLIHQAGLGEPPWEALAQLFAHFGDVQVAALFPVDERGALAAEPAARLGDPAPLRLDDPVLQAARRRRQVVSLSGLPDDAAALSGLLMAVPLCDIQDRLYGVLAVEDLPFSAFTEEHLRLLAVLGAHAGDALALDAQPAAVALQQKLERCHRDAQEHRLAAMLLALRFPAPGPPLERALAALRGIDQPWLREDGQGRPELILLLPLTDERGAAGLLARLDEALREHGGLVGAGVVAHQQAVTGQGLPAAALESLLEASRGG